jgi:hypothetical protein
MPIAVTPPAPPGYGVVFREAGGTVQDVDGDGWEDVTLIYHAMVHTVSINPTLPSNRVLATTAYDLAAGIYSILITSITCVNAHNDIDTLKAHQDLHSFILEETMALTLQSLKAHN